MGRQRRGTSSPEHSVDQPETGCSPVWLKRTAMLMPDGSVDVRFNMEYLFGF